MTFSTNPAEIGRSVTKTCSSDGEPEPSYTITHNGTVISTVKSYTISNVQWTDAGTYECIAKNIVGNDTISRNLNILIMRGMITHS